MSPRSVLLALVILAASPGAASADEHRAARSFADAAARFTRAMHEAVPRAREELARRRADVRICVRMETDPFPEDIPVGDPAPEDLARADALADGARLAGVHVATAPVLARFVGRLDATQTADRRLRSGRAAWRSSLVLSEVYAALPADTCAQLRAWRDAGRTTEPLPGVDLGPLTPRPDDGSGGREDLAVDPGDAFDRKVRAAARRLRELGQGPRRSSRFTGDAAFAPLNPLYVEAFSEGTGA